MPGPNFLKTFKQRVGANIAPSRSCKFIEGHKPYGPSPWCDKPTDGETSYCPEHRAICFRQMDERTTLGFERSVLYVARVSR